LSDKQGEESNYSNGLSFSALQLRVLQSIFPHHLMKKLAMVKKISEKRKPAPGNVVPYSK
jgi:hypothetical protein